MTESQFAERMHVWSRRSRDPAPPALHARVDRVRLITFLEVLTPRYAITWLHHKGMFSGVGEETPHRTEFITLLVGLALLLWTSVGRAVEESQPKVRLESKTKGARLWTF